MVVVMVGMVSVVLETLVGGRGLLDRGNLEELANRIFRMNGGGATLIFSSS